MIMFLFGDVLISFSHDCKGLVSLVDTGYDLRSHGRRQSIRVDVGNTSPLLKVQGLLAVGG